MNRKRRIFLLLAMTWIIVPVLSSCAKNSSRKNRGTASEPAAIVLTEETYALVLAHHDDPYDALVEKGFADVMTEAGRKFSVLRPEHDSVREQRDMIIELIRSHASSIAIEPLDAGVLKDVLKEAMDAGINVCSFGQRADPESRELHIRPVGTGEMTETLLGAVRELTQGSGQWAILSSSSLRKDEAEWIDSIKEALDTDEYKGLQLRSTAYGSRYRTVYDQTCALLQNYPDLKVLCVLAPELMEPAAEALKDQESEVLLTGLGLPSVIEEAGLEEICPLYYLWDPEEIGEVAACVSYALHEDYITGGLDEEFTEKRIGTFHVEKSSDSGTEVTAGSLKRYGA